MGMGFEMVGVALGGYYLGAMIDEKLNWQGFGVALCVLIGFAGWGLRIFFMMKKMMQDNEPD